MAEIKKAGRGRDGVVGLLSAVERLEEDVIGDVLKRSLSQESSQESIPIYVSSRPASKGKSGTAKDSTSDWTAPLGPSAPDADDMLTASVVPDSDDHAPFRTVSSPGFAFSSAVSRLGTDFKRMLQLRTWTSGSGTAAARRAAQTESNEKKAVDSEGKGYDDGYAAATEFGEFDGSRLGFATQYMEDNIVALLSSNALPDGNEDDYRKGFVRGLAEGEMKVMKDMLERSFRSV
ncbi:hypothetical protein FRC12_024471 [Ceratobasidium sp. 428]|nr:hypothetical protein FRC12_024471 [Ceratobasidium sp. 428]